MRRCEITIELHCQASLLKGDDCRQKRAPFGSTCCIVCDLTVYEDAKHMIMQCPFYDVKNSFMFREIDIIYPGLDMDITVSVLMGKHIKGWNYDVV